MNFWKNPENNPLKVLILALAAGAAGGFIYTAMNNGGTTGRVIGLNAGRSASSMLGTSNVNVTPLGTGTGSTTTPPPLTTTGGTGATGPATTGGAGGSTSGTTSGITTGGAIQGGASTKGETTGVDGMGTVDGRESPCYSIAPITLVATLGMPTAPVPNTVYVGPSATSPTAPGHWLNFTLRNPSDCPVVVSKATIFQDTNDMTVWPPVQHVKLTTAAGVQVGDTFNVPGTGTMPVGPTSFVFAHSTAHPFAVTIAPHASVTFNVTSASQNVNANEYGGATPPATSATGATIPGTGTPVYFKMQLTQFYSKNAISGAAKNQTVSAGTIPTTIKTPAINIYN